MEKVSDHVTEYMFCVWSQRYDTNVNSAVMSTVWATVVHSGPPFLINNLTVSKDEILDQQLHSSQVVVCLSTGT
jgi:hypothetical protein